METPPSSFALTTISGEDHLTLEKPTVVCLGGIDIADEAGAREFAETAKTLLRKSGMAMQPQIFSTHYPNVAGNSSRENFRLIRGFQKNGATSPMAEMAKNSADEFLNAHIMPLIPDVQSLSGHAREEALGTIERSLKQLNIFSYSHGSIVARHLHDVMDAALEQKGFSEAERVKAMGGVKLIALADATIYKYPTDGWKFQSLHVTSENDRRMQPMITEPIEGDMMVKNLHGGKMQLVRAHIPVDAIDKEGHALECYLGSLAKPDMFAEMIEKRRNPGVSSKISSLVGGALKDGLHDSANLIKRLPSIERMIERSHFVR